MPRLLTAAETRVAALLVQGRTVAEAARALRLSPKTVEGHVTRIYRKLGVRSRDELATALEFTPLGRDSGEEGPNGLLPGRRPRESLRAANRALPAATRRGCGT